MTRPLMARVAAAAVRVTNRIFMASSEVWYLAPGHNAVLGTKFHTMEKIRDENQGL
jgi:hypothetical protein